MRGNKKVFSRAAPMQALALSALMIASLGLAAVPGFAKATAPPFNPIISNAGLRHPL